VLPAVSGASVADVIDEAGAACLARLITVVPGSPAEGRPVTTELAGQVGALAARTSLALQGLFHRAGGRVLDWDVSRTHHLLGEPDVLNRLGALGPRVARVLPRLAAAADATTALPAGLNHADVTLTNILTSTAQGAPAITGLVDFGDMHHTAHVCDLAVTLTSVLRNTARQQPTGTWDLAGAVLTGYQRHRPLTPQEANVLGDLIISRLALTLVISQRRSATQEDNQAYISQYDASTRRILGELLDLGPDQVTRRLHTLTGTSRVILPGTRRPAADNHAGGADSATGYHPDHVATFAAPRRSTGGVDRQTAAERVVAAAARLADHGDKAALVLADLGFTSEGILDAPADFIAGLLDGAHSAGALFLADEVQVGFGRVGPAFWRFAAPGVTPDFVTLGKPMGAGYPIGALITRREIAESLARDYEYFSTFAGTPAAAAASLAVLDVLENEHIPERTATVGNHLRDKLHDLARQDARLSDVRGTGLIAGIEISGQPHTQDNAGRRALARVLLDALRDHHVLAGLTGPDGTVLKVRPPLIWHTDHADLFAAAVAESLATKGARDRRSRA
jgi:Ser/Thr protein kinase RdoA (MazF antagonist)